MHLFALLLLACGPAAEAPAPPVPVPSPPVEAPEPARAPPARMQSTNKSQAAQIHSSGLPHLVVDEAHRLVGGKGLQYLVPPGPSAHLSVGDAKVTDPQGVGPDAVHLMFGVRKLYRFDWPASGELVLSAETATPIEGSGDWPGFHPGTQVMLAVGREATEGRAAGFQTRWVTSVDVAALESP